jgi:hypothetical protein
MFKIKDQGQVFVYIAVQQCNLIPNYTKRIGYSPNRHHTGSTCPKPMPSNSTMCTYPRIVNIHRLGPSDSRFLPGSRGSESGHDSRGPKQEKLLKKNGKNSGNSCQRPDALMDNIMDNAGI